MPTAKVGTLNVDLFLNMARFVTDLDKVPKLLSQTASKFKSVGKDLSVGITAPLLAIGTAAFAAANKVDEAMDDIRSTTGATGAVLKTLEGDFKKVGSTVPSSLEDVGKAIGALNQRLGLTGPALQEMAKQELNLARLTKSDLTATIEGTTKVFEKWNVKAKDQAATLDTLFKVSQRTGTGILALTGNLTGGGTALKELGFSLKQSTVLLAQLEKSGVDVGAVLASMKKGVVEFSKAGEDAPRALSRIIASIQNAGTVARSNEIAIKSFGARAGLELAAAIRKGQLAVDDMVRSIDGSRETINRGALETESFGEKWILLKNNVILALEPLGKELLVVFEQSILPSLQSGIEKIKALTEAFSKMTPFTKNLIFGVLGLAAALGPLAIGIGLVTTAVGNLTKAGTFLFATPWGLAIIGIGAAVASAVLIWERLHVEVKEVGVQMAAAHGPTLQMVAAHKSTAQSLTDRAAATVELTKQQEEFNKSVLKLVESFKDQNQITTEIAGAIKQLFKDGAPAVELYEKWGKNLQAWGPQIDAATLKILKHGEALSKLMQQAKGSAKIVPADLGILGGSATPNIARTPIQLLIDQLQESLPKVQTIAKEIGTALDVTKIQEWNEAVIDGVNSFIRQNKEIGLSVATVERLIDSGQSLEQIYRQYGGLLETYPELLGRGTKAALEMGKIQTILKDGWINIGRTLEQSVSRAVQSFKGMRDALKSIFNSIKQAALQMIGDIVGSMVRNLFGPLLQGIGAAIPLGAVGGGSSGAAGSAAAGASGGGLLSGLSNLLKGLTGGAGGLAGAGNAALSLGGPIGLAAALSGNKGALIGGGLGAAFGGIGGFLSFGLAGLLQSAAFFGPIGAAVGLGVSLLLKALTKTTGEAASKEFGRDFGGVSAGSKTFESFLAQIGVTSKQAEGIRKDLLSSPKWLTEVAFPLAQQQGKTAEFLKSLERIETVMGTFNFRSVFEEGLKSGDFSALNKAFAEAFKTNFLLSLIPDFATRLAAATDGAVNQSLVKTRLTTRPIAVSPGAQPVTPGSVGGGGGVGDIGGKTPVIIYSPNNTIIDGEGLAKLEREQLFPDFVRHIEGNLGELKVKFTRAIGPRNA